MISVAIVQMNATQEDEKGTLENLKKHGNTSNGELGVLGRWCKDNHPDMMKLVKQLLESVDELKHGDSDFVTH